MIYESYPWKQDLGRRKRLFLKYNTEEHFQKNYEATYTVLEKAIFYSAFIIRKLLDCKTKLSDKADRYALHVEKISPVGKIKSWRNWLCEDSHDWANPKKWTLQGRNVCNFLIHSCVFEFVSNEDQTVAGFMVASDKDRNKALYHVRIDDWLDYMEFIASDSIVELIACRKKTKHGSVLKMEKRGPMEWLDDKQIEEFLKQEP